MCASYRVVFPPKMQRSRPVLHPHARLQRRAHGIAKHAASAGSTVVPGIAVVATSAVVAAGIVGVAAARVVVVAAAAVVTVVTVGTLCFGVVVVAAAAAVVVVGGGASVVATMTSTPLPSPLPDASPSLNAPNVRVNAPFDQPFTVCGLEYDALQQPPVSEGLFDPQNVKKFRVSSGL